MEEEKEGNHFFHVGGTVDVMIQYQYHGKQDM